MKESKANIEMKETVAASGSCLCGAVKVRASKVSKQIGACHCDMCRTWSSGPLLCVESHGEVSFSGEENIRRYNSSEWADRGFCMQCGTNLFYFLKPKNQYILSVALLDQVQGMVFDHQVFIEEKPKYYSFANETKNLTGEELFAQAGAE